MFVERAEPEDWNDLARIYRDSRREAVDWLPGAQTREHDLARDAEGECVWVVRAERGGRALGFVAVWAPDKFVHHLYVDAAARGRGAGTALLRAAREQHGGPLRLKCVSANLAARRFYEGLGWRVAGGGESEDGGYLLYESPDLESSSE